ncbi:MAG TPA: hypothetical protein VE734_10750 [Terriglobales bacterium]|nr:hypothetical protein [Terriglobales bacterium]
MHKRVPACLGVLVLISLAVLAQTAAPAARSQDEAVGLGYMRTVVNAQKEYKKKHGAYATSLPALVHSGSFTKRMATSERGAYTVHFRGKPERYTLAMTPKQFDANHRAFYVDETGKVRVEDAKPAGAESPLLK